MDIIRRRHNTTEQEGIRRLRSDGVFDTYTGNGDRLDANQKNQLHHKSCNMISSNLAVQDSGGHQLYQARSVHHIPESSSNYRRGNCSSPNLAISSQGLVYICNFKSPPHHNSHKISNQINGRLLHTRSGKSP